MTVPTGEYATDDYEEMDEDTAYNPVLVELAGTVQRQNAPDFGGCALFTAPVAGTGIPVQILQRRPTREQAYVTNNDPANSIIIAERLDKVQLGIGYIIGPGGTQKIESQQPYYAVANNVNGTSPASLSATGSLAIVTPGQTIASAALPAGTYTVNWSVIITGTVTAADDNNVQIMVGATVIAVSVNADNGNQIYPQAPVVIVIPAGGATVSIQSVTGGSGTATYKSGFTATPVGATGSVAGPVSVSVLDEAWLVLDNAHPERGYRGKD